MKRLTASVLLTASALAISAIALPAIGYVPWQTRPDPAAQPAQIRTMVKADPADARASSLSALRGLAQDSLQALTDRDPAMARERLNEMQQAWSSQRDALQDVLLSRGSALDQAIRKASVKLAAPSTELFISKAAVLDVLSALDAAAAPRPAVVASSAPVASAAAPAGQAQASAAH